MTRHPMPPPAAQLSLAGIDAPRVSDRLFFGVLPDAAALERIAGLAQALRDAWGLQGRPRSREHFHVTLHHLGDFAGVPPDVVARARAAAAGVAVPAFQARFDRVGSFAGRAGKLPFVLLGEEGPTGLHRMHAALAERLAISGWRGVPERTFVPHVTLLYDAQAVPVQPVEPVSWPVREFVLIHSLLGRAEYRLLGRWVLPA